MKVKRDVSEAEFREAMGPISEALSDYASAVTALGSDNGHLPASASKGMDELAEQQQWSTADWLEPSRNAHSFGGLLLHSIAEHLSALAAVIGGSAVGPTYAHYAHVRVIIESVPIAAWLLDPTISAKKRIQRSIVYRLDGFTYLKRNTSIPGARQSAAKAYQRFQRYTTCNKWALTWRTCGDETMPQRAHGFSRIALGIEDLDRDDALWSFASSTFHGSSWALLQIDPRHITHNGAMDPTGATVGLGADQLSLSAMAILCWRGVHAVVGARLALMGWLVSNRLADSAARLNAIATEVAAQAAMQPKVI